MQDRTDGKANDRREERSMKALTRTTSDVVKTIVFCTFRNETVNTRGRVPFASRTNASSVRSSFVSYRTEQRKLMGCVVNQSFRCLQMRPLAERAR